MTTTQYQERLISLSKFHDGTNCTVCSKALTEHIGALPCMTSEPRKVSGLYDLPIFEYAWNGLKVGR